MTVSTDFVTRVLQELGPAPTAQTLCSALVPEIHLATIRVAARIAPLLS